MKLTVRCRSGLRIQFEGTVEELERFDGFLAELARLERDRLAPGRTDVDHSSDHSCDRSGSPQVAAFEPVPTPSPPSAPELDAEPDDAPRPEDDSPVPAGGRTPYGDSPQITLAAIARLAVCSKRELVAETGIPDSTLTPVLRRLIDDGKVIATGATTARRFRLATAEDTDPADDGFAAGIDALSRAALTPAPEPAPAVTPPPSEPISDLEQQVVELVHRHGPVTPDWIADQIVKNRRDTGLMMRALEERGYLQNTGSGWFDIPGREEAQAA